MIKINLLNTLKFFSLIFVVNYVIASEPNQNDESYESNSSYYNQNENQGRGGIGQYGTLSNPMNDRAKGYLLKGVIKNAVTNYGNFITWDEHPAGLWGEYSYLPHVGMIAGVPGQQYSSNFSWYKVSESSVSGLASEFSDIPSGWDEEIYLSAQWEALYGDELTVFCSEDAYETWAPNSDGTGGEFVGVVFDVEDDRGNLGEQVKYEEELDFPDHDAITAPDQWTMSRNFTPSVICVSVQYHPFEVDNPNKSNALIGLVYPWAKRPALIERLDEFDYYDYGDDQETWTADDNYVYYGANVAESWFSRYNPSTNVDWHATNLARENTHNIEVSAGDLFGDTPFSDPGDTYPLLAHSAYSTTWPDTLNVETGLDESYWPGWYADDWDCDYTGCSPCTKLNDDCWYQVPGRFVSDNDVFMEFDDRWAHRGNTIGSTGQYEQTGYPMGIKVRANAHSYGVSYAEDIMFVTVVVTNESDQMIMPDGTKLNAAQGFHYKDMSFGFYMDADVLSTDLFGNFNVHTNGDDFMTYYNEDIYIPSSDGSGEDQKMNISMAIIGDYDGISGQVTGFSMDDEDQDPGNDFGIVAVQMLDSPLATEDVDLDGDGIIDRYEGEKLKMTDWHWFDWYNRPGVTYREGSGGCCAGDPGKPQARNKEEIQYKIMIGDTTNLTVDEKLWFFHADPELDELDPEFNPNFDSVEDLKQTVFFTDDEEGLDCVLKMTSGPFSLNIGEEANFSFCIIFGQNMEDLISNAEFAQIMYNNKYQGYTAPKKPILTSTYDHGQISLHWDDDAEYDEDVVTGYSDFEGYKIYKSVDGGVTWGNAEDEIYDDSGVQVGWRPIAQYDLTEQDDLEFCVALDYADSNNNGVWDYIDANEAGDYRQYIECVNPEDSNAPVEETLRDMNISGADPRAPWFTVGDNTGFDNISPATPYCVHPGNDGLCPGDEGYDAPDENEKTYKYTYVDNNVIDGTVYTYSVTAYDMGVAPSYDIVWNEFESGFAPDTVTTQANPLGFSSPGGYQFVENSKGTTILDENFIQVASGYSGDFSINQVEVWPNPYIVSSGYNNETEYQSRIRFVKLPCSQGENVSGATITVYTITGEKVYSWNAADRIDSEPGDDCYNSWWDLRTINNQEVAPGLYLFSVEYEGQTFVGKFAVIR